MSSTCLLSCKVGGLPTSEISSRAHNTGEKKNTQISKLTDAWLQKFKSKKSLYHISFEINSFFFSCVFPAGHGSSATTTVKTVFTLYTTPATWNTAKNVCWRNGGRLASVHKSIVTNVLQSFGNNKWENQWEFLSLTSVKVSKTGITETVWMQARSIYSRVSVKSYTNPCTLMC